MPSANRSHTSMARRLLGSDKRWAKRRQTAAPKSWTFRSEWDTQSPKYHQRWNQVSLANQSASVAIMAPLERKHPRPRRSANGGVVVAAQAHPSRRVGFLSQPRFIPSRNSAFDFDFRARLTS